DLKAQDMCKFGMDLDDVAEDVEVGEAVGAVTGELLGVEAGAFGFALEVEVGVVVVEADVWLEAGAEEGKCCFSGYGVEGSCVAGYCALQDFRNGAKRVDVNLRFISVRYFHESGFRLRGLRQDSLEAIQVLRRTVPEDFERALYPFLGLLNANTLRLSINATSGDCHPNEACVVTIGRAIEGASTRVLPGMESALRVSMEISNLAGSLLNMARPQMGGRIGLNLLSVVTLLAATRLLQCE
ncbi:unnamed protein product, partial [Prorocentrum cordatum]